MGDFISIEVRGDEEIAAYFDQSAVRLRGEMRRATISATHAVGEDAAVYPPETEANFPPAPYYIRGAGTQISNDFNIGESEQLGERWTERVTFSATEIKGEVTNVASYAPHVQGRTAQDPLHAGHGWRTAGKILQDNISRVRDIFNTAIYRALLRRELRGLK